MSSTLVAFAGLPGTGKSTLARKVALALGAPLLDKDRVREALFGPSHVAYTREQDDFVVGILFQAIAHLLSSTRPAYFVLDGRTFSKREQLNALREFARTHELELRIVECTCAPETAYARIDGDADVGAHPATNRGVELYQKLARSADPIPEPKCVVVTDAATPEELVGVCVEYARTQSASNRAGSGF